MTGGGQRGRFSRRSKQEESPDSKAADGGASTTDERSNLAASDTSSYSGLRRRARDGDMVIMETYFLFQFGPQIIKRERETVKEYSVWQKKKKKKETTKVSVPGPVLL